MFGYRNREFEIYNFSRIGEETTCCFSEIWEYDSLIALLNCEKKHENWKLVLGDELKLLYAGKWVEKSYDGYIICLDCRGIKHEKKLIYTMSKQKEYVSIEELLKDTKIDGNNIKDIFFELDYIEIE